jgi:putative membrane protein
MLWLKAFHVIAVVAWFAGLFYLPRLYVYHADAKDSISIERFLVMERRLFAIMTIGAAMAWGSARRCWRLRPLIFRWDGCGPNCLLVLLVIAYHLFCYKLMRDFARNRNGRSARWYRGFNEVPSCC